MSYTVHQAKTNLSRLIKEAEEGKEVIITRGKDPVVRLVPIAARIGPPKPDPPQEVTAKGSGTPPAFDPLTDEELTELGLE